MFSNKSKYASARNTLILACLLNNPQCGPSRWYTINDCVRPALRIAQKICNLSLTIVRSLLLRTKNYIIYWLFRFGSGKEKNPGAGRAQQRIFIAKSAVVHDPIGGFSQIFWMQNLNIIIN